MVDEILYTIAASAAATAIYIRGYRVGQRKAAQELSHLYHLLAQIEREVRSPRQWLEHIPPTRENLPGRIRYMLAQTNLNASKRFLSIDTEPILRYLATGRISVDKAKVALSTLIAGNVPSLPAKE